MAEKREQCARPGCKCPRPSTDDYCSDYCANAKESGQQSPQSLQTTGGEGGGQESGVTRRGQYAPLSRTGSPFTFMRRFSEEMDRLFEDFGFGDSLFAPGFGRGLSRFSELAQSM